MYGTHPALASVLDVRALIGVLGLGGGSRGSPYDRHGVSRMAWRSVLGKATLVVVSTSLSVVGAELALRVATSPSEGYQVWPPFLHRTFEVDPGAASGVSGTSEFRVNSRGLRADEYTGEHELTVLALGGSTTECLILDQEEAWPKVVQDRLGARLGIEVWVGNAGVSGLSTRHHLFQMAPLLDEYPSTRFVLLLAGVNDFGLRLYRDDEYDPDYLTREGADLATLRRAFKQYPREYRDNLPWGKRLELYDRVRLARDFVRSRFRGRAGEAQDASGSNLGRWRENRQNATLIREDLPDLSDALREYEINLRRLVGVARDAGAEVLLMTQPSLWGPELSKREEELLWWGGVGNFLSGDPTEYYSAAALERGMNAYNRRLLDVCRDEDALCLDLAARLPKDTTVFYDGIHLTEHGARLVADLVSATIAEATGERPRPGG